MALIEEGHDLVAFLKACNETARGQNLTGAVGAGDNIIFVWKGITSLLILSFNHI